MNLDLPKELGGFSYSEIYLKIKKNRRSIENIMAIQIKRGTTETQNKNATLVLEDGQPYYNKDTKALYVGDGSTQLSNLEGVTSAKLGSSTVGTTTKPIYLSSGTAAECKTYAGGTVVQLNGTDMGEQVAAFYAPQSSGTANQVLISKGHASEPEWVAQSSLSVGSATKADTATTATTATSATSATRATYASSNTSKGTIETRLTKQVFHVVRFYLCSTGSTTKTNSWVEGFLTDLNDSPTSGTYGWQTNYSSPTTSGGILHAGSWNSSGTIFTPSWSFLPTKVCYDGRTYDSSGKWAVSGTYGTNCIYHFYFGDNDASSLQIPVYNSSASYIYFYQEIRI